MYRRERLRDRAVAGVRGMHLELAGAVALDPEQITPSRERAVNVGDAGAAGLGDPGDDGVERGTFAVICGIS